MPEGTVAADQLRLFIERIERLEEEKKAMADDIRDVYSEAKATGYDPKTMRKVVALRKMETHVRQESAAILETYCAALGLDASSEYARRPFRPEATIKTPIEEAVGATITLSDGTDLGGAIRNAAEKAGLTVEG